MAGVRNKADRRPLALAITVAGVLALGGLIAYWPRSLPTPDMPAPQSALPDARVDPEGHVTAARANEIDMRFKQAAIMLHAGRYEDASVALHRLLELAPAMPEAHVNMGFSMVGLERYDVARDFFHGAIELRPTQANAYYGLAMALEGLDDLEGALGAMRTYIHLSRPDDPYLAKARSALWEWETALGRTPSPDATADSLATGTDSPPPARP